MGSHVMKEAMLLDYQIEILSIRLLVYMLADLLDNFVAPLGVLYLRLVGIMLQISIIILFRISLKISSLCSILFFLCY